MKRTFAFVLLSGVLFGGTATAQEPRSKTPSVTAFTLLTVKVTGTTRYTEKEILPAAGLQLGQAATEADFQNAVQRLGTTGLFSDVAYSYSYSGTGAKLELQLKDVEQNKLVPAHFENFIWYTDAQLVSELQRRVPLFQQLLPASGSLPDQVSEALQAMLDEEQIQARVDYLREAKQNGEDLIGIAYRVMDFAIHIRNAEFPGAAPEHVPPLTAAARRLAGAEYVRSSLVAVARLDLLPVYLKRGYLKASFGPTDARVVTQTSSEAEVDVLFPVTPGKVYSATDLTWKGNVVFPAEQLQRLIHLPGGQPADAVRLANDLESVEKLYRTRGYMTAHINSNPTFDEDKSTVHFDLNVVEGEQFKMGELEILGLDTQAKTRLQDAWTLREGEPYNGEYAAQFLEKTFRLLPGVVRWDSSVHESLNAQDKTVDVTIRFTPQ